MRRDLGRLTSTVHDVVIVGGGIHGVCAAYDAAQRGLSVALVEANDFGGGVSWNSLKTIHGGLRHLQRADLAGLRESVRERRALLRIAPRLVLPLPFLVPTYGHGLKGREALALGVRLNDLLSADRNRELPPERRVVRGRLLGPDAVRALVPGVPSHGLTGGVEWTDAQVVSSERLVMGFAHAAAGAGAVLVNHATVTGVNRSGGAVAGVTVEDRAGGGLVRVSARAVVNAAGPSTDAVLAMAGVTRPRVPLLRAINLVLARPVVVERAVGARAGGRFLFVVPWRGRAMVGTAYAPAASPDDGEAVAFLAEAARAFPWAGLEARDVTLVHRGLVPGAGGANGLWTRSRVVDHGAGDAVAGLYSMVGVKYTTARALAEQAIDRIGRRAGRPLAPCRTATAELPEARPLEGPLETRARHAVREEMALTLADAVMRRLDLGTAGPPSATERDVVAGVMAAELGWSASRVEAEKEALERAYPAWS